MKTDTFDYHLPAELIAQDPLAVRASSRLLMLDRAGGEVSHRVFHELPELLRPGDCLVLNTTRVLPARLRGRKLPTGGSVELLLLERLEGSRWKAMTGGASLRPGVRVAFADGRLEGTVIDGPAEGIVVVELSAADGDVERAIDEAGALHNPRARR
jgi:S-adenosylmethionine:tRNA ribosyltransferase-isomerase